MSNRPTMREFRKKALSDPHVKAAYVSLSAAFEMKSRMIAMRKKAGLTQEQMAERLGTKKSNISRLENINSGISPRLATVEDYARVLGYSVRVEFDRQAS